MTPVNKEEAVKQAYDKARIYTPQYHSWSQGTTLALQDAFDMRDDNVFKAATGLHGGFGGMGDICGSLLGASLMLGLMLGSGPEKTPKPGPPEKDISMELVGNLYKWFKKEFGSVKCRTVRAKHEREVNGDVGLTEPDRMARLFAKCDELAGKTSARTAEMLWDAIRAKKGEG